MRLFEAQTAILLVSDLLLREPDSAPPRVQSVLLSVPFGVLERVVLTNEAERLRDLYIAADVVGPASMNDAWHVALATVARADMIVSWNFKPIVHFEKMRGFNAVNLREGYARLDIFAPPEVV
jgi:hypothetical protein